MPDISVAGPIGAVVVVVGYLLAALSAAQRRTDTATEARVVLLQTELDLCRTLRGKEATLSTERIYELESQLNKLRKKIDALR